MAIVRCETCGYDYDTSLAIIGDGQVCGFDGPDWAIPALTPCRVIGHGADANSVLSCCALCTREEAASGLSERADETEEHSPPSQIE